MADTQYRVLIGCNYPPDDTRAEEGDTITVPEAVAKSLLLHSAVELESVAAKREKDAAEAAEKAAAKALAAKKAGK